MHAPKKLYSANEARMEFVQGAPYSLIRLVILKLFHCFDCL